MKVQTTNKKAYHKKRGFSLAELIIIVAVVGILTVILVPTFSNVVNKTNAKSALSDARNMISKYIVDKMFDDKSGGGKKMPEQIVVAVKKAGQFYLFGYNTRSNGEVMVSEANGKIESETLDELIRDWSWNGKNGDTPGPVITAESKFDIESDGAFYLVPKDAETKSVATKDVPSAELEDKYNFQDENINGGKFKSSNIIEGLLLPGTFTGESLVDEETGDSDEIFGDLKYKVTFKHVSTTNLDADFNSSNVMGPKESRTASPFIASDYHFSWDKQAGDRYWYTFAGMYYNSTEVSSLEISSDITVTVCWDKHTVQTHTLTFEQPEGVDLQLGTGVSQVMTIDEGTNIASYISNSRAAKSYSQFMGWKLQGTEIVYNASVPLAPITITGDMVLEPVFDDIMYTVTYKSGDGDGDDVTRECRAGSDIELISFEDSGFTAPEDQKFFMWRLNGLNYAECVYTGIICTGDVTVTAQYVDNYYTIKYDTGILGVATFPTLSPEDSKGTPGEEKTITVGGAVAADWYHIGGYSVMATDSSIMQINVSDGEQVTIPAEITAGATVFITVDTNQNRLNVQFNDDEGANAITNRNLSEEIHSFDLNEPTKEGFNFAGWTVAPGDAEKVNLTGNRLTVLDKTHADVEVTITANWTVDTGEKTITVTCYDAWNNESLGTIDVTVQASATELTPADFETAADANGIFFVPNGNVAINGNTATANGERHKINVTGDEGTDYVVVTNSTGLRHISGTTSGIPTTAQAETAMARNYWLMNNIDASSITEPIGWTNDYDVSFTGKLEGNNKTISGLRIIGDVDDTTFVGLFAINDGYIANLNIPTPVLQSSMHVGPVAGANCGTIKHVNVTLGSNALYAKYAAVGGIAGSNDAGGQIIDCHVFSTVSKCEDNITAGNWDGINASYMCYNFGTDSTDYYGVFAGGIAGFNADGSTISKSSVGGGSNSLGIRTLTYSSRNVTAYGYFVGGITGMNHSSTISECWAYKIYLNHNITDKSYIAGARYIGGIAGFNCTGSTIEYVWSRGVSTESVYEAFGGLCGSNLGTLRYAWAYVGGYTYAEFANTCYDTVGENDPDEFTAVYTWNEFYANSPKTANYSSMANMLPSTFSTSYWAEWSEGPQLVNNGYRSAPF